MSPLAIIGAVFMITFGLAMIVAPARMNDATGRGSKYYKANTPSQIALVRACGALLLLVGIGASIALAVGV